MGWNCFDSNDDDNDKEGKIPLGKRIRQVLQDKFPRLHRLILRVTGEGAPSKIKRRRKRKASSLIPITSPDHTRAQQKIDRKTAEDENRSNPHEAKPAIDNGQGSEAVKATQKNVKDDRDDEDEVNESRGNTKGWMVSPPADDSANRNQGKLPDNTLSEQPTASCPQYQNCGFDDSSWEIIIMDEEVDMDDKGVFIYGQATSDSPTTERVAPLVNDVITSSLEDFSPSHVISPTDTLDLKKSPDNILPEQQPATCPQHQNCGFDESSWEIIIMDDEDDMDDKGVFIYGQATSNSPTTERFASLVKDDVTSALEDPVISRTDTLDLEKSSSILSEPKTTSCPQNENSGFNESSWEIIFVDNDDAMDDGEDEVRVFIYGQGPSGRTDQGWKDRPFVDDDHQVIAIGLLDGKDEGKNVGKMRLNADKTANDNRQSSEVVKDTQKNVKTHHSDEDEATGGREKINRITVSPTADDYENGNISLPNIESLSPTSEHCPSSTAKQVVSLVNGVVTGALKPLGKSPSPVISPTDIFDLEKSPPILSEPKTASCPQNENSGFNESSWEIIFVDDDGSMDDDEGEVRVFVYGQGPSGRTDQGWEDRPFVDVDHQFIAIGILDGKDEGKNVGKKNNDAVNAEIDDEDNVSFGAENNEQVSTDSTSVTELNYASASNDTKMGKLALDVTSDGLPIDHEKVPEKDPRPDVANHDGTMAAGDETSGHGGDNTVQNKGCTSHDSGAMMGDATVATENVIPISTDLMNEATGASTGRNRYTMRLNADKTANDNRQSSEVVKDKQKNVRNHRSDDEATEGRDNTNRATEGRDNTNRITVSPAADDYENGNISLPNIESPSHPSEHCPSPTTKQVASLMNGVVKGALKDLGKSPSPVISPTDIFDQEKSSPILSEPKTTTGPQNENSGFNESSWEIIFVDDDAGIADDEDEVRVFIYGQGPSGRTDQGWEDRPFVDVDHQFSAIGLLDGKDEGKNVGKKNNDAVNAEIDDGHNISFGTENNEQVSTEMDHKNTSVTEMNYASASNDTKMDKLALNVTSDGLPIDHEKVPEKDPRPDVANHDGAMAAGYETPGHGGDDTVQYKGCTPHDSRDMMGDATVATENVVPISSDLMNEATGASTGRNRYIMRLNADKTANDNRQSSEVVKDTQKNVKNHPSDEDETTGGRDHTNHITVSPAADDYENGNISLPNIESPSPTSEHYPSPTTKQGASLVNSVVTGALKDLGKIPSPVISPTDIFDLEKSSPMILSETKSASFPQNQNSGLSEPYWEIIFADDDAGTADDEDEVRVFIYGQGPSGRTDQGWEDRPFVDVDHQFSAIGLLDGKDEGKNVGKKNNHAVNAEIDDGHNISFGTENNEQVSTEMDHKNTSVTEMNYASASNDTKMDKLALNVTSDGLPKDHEKVPEKDPRPDVANHDGAMAAGYETPGHGGDDTVQYKGCTPHDSRDMMGDATVATENVVPISSDLMNEATGASTGRNRYIMRLNADKTANDNRQSSEVVKDTQKNVKNHPSDEDETTGGRDHTNHITVSPAADDYENGNISLPNIESPSPTSEHYPSPTTKQGASLVNSVVTGALKDLGKIPSPVISPTDIFDLEKSSPMILSETKSASFPQNQNSGLSEPYWEIIFADDDAGTADDEDEVRVFIYGQGPSGRTDQGWEDRPFVDVDHQFSAIGLLDGKDEGKNVGKKNNHAVNAEIDDGHNISFGTENNEQVSTEMDHKNTSVTEMNYASASNDTKMDKLALNVTSDGLPKDHEKVPEKDPRPDVANHDGAMAAGYETPGHGGDDTVQYKGCTPHDSRDMMGDATVATENVVPISSDLMNEATGASTGRNRYIMRLNADKTANDNRQSSEVVKDTQKNVKNHPSDEDETTGGRDHTNHITVSPAADDYENGNISLPNIESPSPTSEHYPSPTTKQGASLVNSVVTGALKDLGKIPSPVISPTDIFDLEKSSPMILSETKSASFPQNQNSGLSEPYWEIIFADDDAGTADDEDEVRVFIYGQGPSGRTDQGWEDRPFVDDDHQAYAVGLLDGKDEGKNVGKKDNDVVNAEIDDEHRVQFGIGDKDDVCVGLDDKEHAIPEIDQKATSEDKSMVATKFALNIRSDGLQIHDDNIPDKDQRPGIVNHDWMMAAGDGTVTTENMVLFFSPMNDAIGASTRRWRKLLIKPRPMRNAGSQTGIR